MPAYPFLKRIQREIALVIPLSRNALARMICGLLAAAFLAVPVDAWLTQASWRGTGAGSAIMTYVALAAAAIVLFAGFRRS